MRQRRLNLKTPRNEMPSPGDPRLKAYEQQREMDRQALILVEGGATLNEAFGKAYATGGLVPPGTLAVIHQDYTIPRVMAEEMLKKLTPASGAGTVNITVKL